MHERPTSQALPLSHEALAAPRFAHFFASVQLHERLQRKTPV